MESITLLRTLRARFQRAPSFVQESLVFFAFLLLTALMTWPWIAHVRDATPDAGDPYFASWVLWWDYHQTFHDPLNLFQGNIFFPYHYSLAFSEHHYGIALFFFPLFALGLAPLTVHSIATLLAFAFTGYGAFRLARTLTGSVGVAWIAGIVFAFIPYRFGQLSHLVYLSSGWIPLLLEALVLFTRRTSKRRAIWLGITFFFNALSSIHWFVLTLIPLALSLAILVIRNDSWRDTKLWKRAFVAFGIAGLGLLPFLIPYVKAARLYGFVRSAEESLFYSATLRDWLVGEFRNKMWHGLNGAYRAGERQLFPGLLPPLLSLAAIFLVTTNNKSEKTRQGILENRWVLVVLDFVIFSSLILMITISGYGFFKLRIFGHYLFSLNSITPVVWTLFLAGLARLIIAYPKVYLNARESSLRGSVRCERRSDAFWLGLVWTVIGFFGSLGMNFVFHRALYDFIPLFRSIRVPARWAMICYLGMALLAGVGTKQLATLLSHHWSKVSPTLVFVVIACALLVEQRAAPLNLIHGEVDPDALTVRLKKTPLAGGIVELPYGEGGPPEYVYTLRAADHGRPLVTAISGFTPPIQAELQFESESQPIPEKLIDLLESIPCSYLVIHHRFLESEERLELERLLRRNVTTGRLRYVNSFGEADLYAVTRIEPNAQTEASLPSFLTISDVPLPSDAALETSEPPSLIDDSPYFVRIQYQDLLGRDPDRGGLEYWTVQLDRCGLSPLCLRQTRVNISAAFFSSEEFQQKSLFIYQYYRRVLGRDPSHAEFLADRATFVNPGNLESGKATLLNDWIRKKEFVSLYPANLNNADFVDRLLTRLKGSGIDLSNGREQLIEKLNSGVPRPQVLRNLMDMSPLSAAEYNHASILMDYFVYLGRDPDPTGYAFWESKLDNNDPSANRSVIQAFITSNEYRSRFRKR